MKYLLLVATFAALPSLAQAQTGTDFQFRPLLHWQAGHLAGWDILPDIAQKPLKGLFVVGFLIEGKEIMAGVVLDTKGSVMPVFNLRCYSKDHWTDLYTEVQVRPDRGLASVFVTVPLFWGARAGAEFEMVSGFTGKVRSTAGLGPRASLKIPRLPLTVAVTAFKNMNSNVVVRTYLVYKLEK